MHVDEELKKLSGRWVQIHSNDDGVEPPIDEYGPEPTTVISGESSEIITIKS